MKKKLLGYVGVDSGQLLVCDPCYIDSEWSNTQFSDIRIYEHKKTKRIFKYESFWEASTVKASQRPQTKIEIFPNYETKTSTGKTINEMLAKKELKELPVKEKTALIGDFSYGGACETNNANKHQLNYKKGHPGVGITFSSGYGDGVYPVYGTFNKEGRCMKVEIDCSPTAVQKKFFASL